MEFAGSSYQSMINEGNDAEILDSINPIYYVDNHLKFNPNSYELKKLTDICDQNELRRVYDTLKSQLNVVSRQISMLILKNHPSYSAELEKVTEIEHLLSQALDTCKNSRIILDEIRQESTSKSIKLLANHKMTQFYRELLEALKSIRTLHDAQFRIIELTQEGDFCGALELCTECQRVAGTYKKYACISELSFKLIDISASIQSQLDLSMMSSVAFNFNEDRYQQLETTYRLLGKEHIIADRVQAAFMSAIHMAPESILRASLKLESNDKYTLQDISKSVTLEDLVSFILKLCTLLWGIHSNYHRLIRYYAQEKISEISEIKQKLETGLPVIWNESLQQVVFILRNRDLTSLKFNYFLQLVDALKRFVEFGRLHFTCTSDTLVEILNKQMTQYFNNYHNSKLEELSTYFESEGWTPVPMHAGFNVFELQEFSFFNNSGFIPKTNSIDQNEILENSNDSNYTLMDADMRNPFESLLHSPDSEKNDLSEKFQDSQIESDSESESQDELLRGSSINDEEQQDAAEYLSHKKKRHSSKIAENEESPVLCNSALLLLRLFGNYLNMISLLQEIAYDGTVGLSQLFESYLYMVYLNFCPSMDGDGSSLYAEPLVSLIKRIEQSAKTLHIHQKRNNMFGGTADHQEIDFAQRIIATESLIFIAQQVILLKEYLSTKLPQSKLPFLQQFFVQTVHVTPFIRGPIYGMITMHAVDYGQVTSSIVGVNWDLNELMSQHNNYVDIIVQQLTEFNQILTKTQQTVPITKNVMEIIWAIVANNIAHYIVEGYGWTGKKCTSEGRALMQIDFQQLLRKFETITGAKISQSAREHVENYVKAYYLPESTLESWIKQNQKNYNSKQLITLLNVATHVSKKTKLKFISFLEGSDNLQ